MVRELSTRENDYLPGHPVPKPPFESLFLWTAIIRYFLKNQSSGNEKSYDFLQDYKYLWSGWPRPEITAYASNVISGGINNPGVERNNPAERSMVSENCPERTRTGLRHSPRVLKQVTSSVFCHPVLVQDAIGKTQLDAPIGVTCSCPLPARPYPSRPKWGITGTVGQLISAVAPVMRR